MGKYEEYRRHAHECVESGRNALNDERRAAWLRLAREWLAMIPNDLAQTDEKSFAQSVQKGRTGEGESTTSP